MKMTNLYNLIPIESINKIVHIVLQFEKDNSYNMLVQIFIIYIEFYIYI